MTADFDYPETGFVLPEGAELSATELVELAETAANGGFDSVWCSEEWGYSAFSVLSRISERVSVPLGTCVVDAFSRTPATLAANALALAEATDGEFLLGVGTSTPEMVEGFHGVDFERPLGRLRETFEIAELALAGERMDYDGRVFSPEGFELNHSPAGPVPLLNAAVGTHNIALSVEYTDGIMPFLIPFAEIEAAVSLAEERAGAQSDLRVLPVVPTCVGPDGEAARARLAEYVAYCIGSTRVFADVLSRHGFADEVSTVRDRWRAGDRGAAATAIPAEMLDAVGIAGRPERARDRFEAVAEVEAVDGVLITCPPGVSTDRIRTTVEALPP